MTYPVRYEVPYPERVARWKVLIWKLLAAIPHLVVLIALTATLAVAVPVGWIVLLVTGRPTRRLHEYVAGVLRWWARVLAYVLSLTDDFPPFSLSADATPDPRTVEMRCLVGSALAITLVAGTCAAFVSFVGQEIRRDVSYERLLTGAVTTEEASVSVASGVVQLAAAHDPADATFAPLLRPDPGNRLLELELIIENQRHPGEEIVVRTSSFSLRDADGARHEPVIALVEGKVSPAEIASGATGTVRLIFEVPQAVEPTELRYDVLDYIPTPRVGETVVYTLR